MQVWTYDKWFEILEHLLNRSSKLVTINFLGMKDYKNSYLQALKLSNKAKVIFFSNWDLWNNLCIDQDFSSSNFPNLKIIIFDDSTIFGHELNKFMRILSTNESIRESLEFVLIKMIDIYDDSFWFNLLKAKSYGFRRWCVSEAHLYHKKDKRYCIDISTPKISLTDTKCIIFLMYIDFALNKSFESLFKL